MNPEPNVGSQIDQLRKMSLVNSINLAFADASPVELRRWYVRTFVMDPYNLELLSTIEVPNVLRNRDEAASWFSIEHAAIGTRLLFAIDPTLVIPNTPDLLEPEEWKNEMEIVNAIMYVYEPWRTVRYDPEGENWYNAVHPGQWHRHGKGNPSSGMVENRIQRWLNGLDASKHPYVFTRWPIATERYEADSIAARVQMSITSLRKFNRTTTSTSRIRGELERSMLMFLDTSSLNQIKQVTPFSNGALCLVTESYRNTDGVIYVNHPGDLLKLDPDYMVQNANSLPWNDTQGHISHGFHSVDDRGDWSYLDEYEDQLFLETPTYWSFLTHAFPEVEERSAFLRLLGAAMFGSNLKIVAAMIGAANAGKDTVINWLSYLMPGQVATLPFSAFTPHGDEDRGLAPLRGARIATVSGEVGEGKGSKLLAEKIKTVSSGGGKIRVAEKYEKPTDVFFDGMLFLQGNSVPTIQGGDTALYTNRLVAVEFRYPFDLVARSFESLYRSEAPEFAQILFINYLRYNAKGGGMAGINPPDSWRQFTKEFANESNPHGFLESCVVESDVGIPTAQFHSAMSAMIARFGTPYPVGPNFWPKRLRAMGFPTTGPKSIRKRVMENGQRQWMYYLTLDSEKSDGMFNQRHWENALRDSAVTA